jgi:hypothetical protein
MVLVHIVSWFVVFVTLGQLTSLSISEIAPGYELAHLDAELDTDQEHRTIATVDIG